MEVLHFQRLSTQKRRSSILKNVFVLQKFGSKVVVMKLELQNVSDFS